VSVVHGQSALVDILIVLFAAKIAAELAERVGLPAVVGEILAGIAAGPSLLNLVKGGNILAVLAEIGVILLLLNVGLEMDLGELGAVGRAALSVATVGVILPFAGGTGAGLLLGMKGTEAVFVGAALTATSVGITARVFGDLRALAMVEARTVLGAAVADDVLGLVILTVVVRLVETGTVSIVQVGTVVGIAVAFLVGSVLIGIRLVPPVFAGVARLSRSTGTLVGLALAFTLAVAQLASEAKLAPIIGAFVAGICLARSSVSDRISRDLAPVGHLFIPVFFFKIGVEADVEQFTRPKVLTIAGVLLVVAVLSKLAASIGLRGAPGDRLLVGLGMLPRGEVGLIFATIGLQQHVFGSDVYAALLLVVLATTLVCPPLLRWRLVRLRARAAPGSARTPDDRPAGGWLANGDGRLDLAANPPTDEILPVAFDAAVIAEHARPGPRLLDWLTKLPEDELAWDGRARDAFFRLLEQGGPRSWRFLHVTGILQRALPELDEAITRRSADPFEPDPLGPVRWPRLARAHERLASRNGTLPAVARPELVVLAAVVLDATDGDDGRDDPAALARSLVTRLGLSEDVSAEVAALITDEDLLLGMARRGGFEEESVLQLAAHLGSAERLAGLALLTAASHDLEPIDVLAVEQLVELTAQVLSRSDLVGSGAEGAVSERRNAAMGLIEDPAVRERINRAPRSYVLRSSVLDLVRHGALCEPPPDVNAPRVAVVPGGQAGRWKVEIVAHDRVGLLAHEARVLADVGLDVLDAVLATWQDGVALASFGVRSWDRPDAPAIALRLARAVAVPLSTAPVEAIDISFDGFASPWHTVCHVTATNRFGLLAALAAAFAASGASVHSARVSTVDGVASDVFELTGSNGRKLSADTESSIRTALAAGVTGRRRPFRRGWELVPSRS